MAINNLISNINRGSWHCSVQICSLPKQTKYLAKEDRPVCHEIDSAASFGFFSLLRSTVIHICKNPQHVRQRDRQSGMHDPYLQRYFVRPQTGVVLTCLSGSCALCMKAARRLGHSSRVHEFQIHSGVARSALPPPSVCTYDVMRRRSKTDTPDCFDVLTGQDGTPPQPSSRIRILVW